MTASRVNAQVDSIEPLTDSIIKLVITPERYIDYLAGQYLQIVHNNQSFSYSIANAPLGSHQYELHIRHEQHNIAAQQLFAAIKQTGIITIELPCGDCHINTLQNKLPIIFIAGGTGFAPVKALIEQLLANGDQRPLELYWGARSASDLYLNNKVKDWQSTMAHFNYFTLIPAKFNQATLASLVLDNHQQDLQNWQMVISGPFDMAYDIRDVLIKAGVAKEQLYSDAFSFENKRSR